MINKNYFCTGFAFYLGLSPIYWMPYIPLNFFTIIKFALFIYISLYAVLFSIKNYNYFKLSFPGGGFIFSILLMMSFLVLPSLLLGDNANNLIALVNSLQIIIFLIASKVIIHLKKVYFVIKLSLSVLSVFVILSVLMMMIIPLTVNPYNEGLFLLDSGFGGARTGWSPSIGLFIPFILMFSKSLILLLVYLLSQILTGGRAGFYLSALAFPILIFLEKSWQTKIRFILSLVVIFLTFYIYDPSYFDDFRVFESLNSNENAEDFSSGRVSRVHAAWSSILDSPFLGNAMYPSFEGDNVHNVFLKNWALYGFLYFTCSISIVSYVFIKWLKRLKSLSFPIDKKFFIILLIVLVSGSLIGMVEPSIIFSNFTTFSIWWFCFALVASGSFRLTNEFST